MLDDDAAACPGRQTQINAGTVVNDGQRYIPATGRAKGPGSGTFNKGDGKGKGANLGPPNLGKNPRFTHCHHTRGPGLMGEIVTWAHTAELPSDHCCGSGTSYSRSPHQG